MLEEWNKARRHRYKLFRRNVHVIDLRGIDFEKVATVTHGYFFTCEMSAAVNRRVGLRNEKILFTISCKIFNLIRNAALFHVAIRCLNETKLVDSRKSTHRANQTDIRTFRRLNGTNASVMRRMDVAHLKPRPLSAETTRAKSRQTALVR